MAKPYPKKTDKEKQAEIHALTKQMDAAIDSYFVSPEQLKQYLTFMSQFHRFSPANVALIQKQFPGAVAVGSFPFWKAKGYAVRKGEHGQKIWVPMQLQAKFRTKTGDWKPLKQATPEEQRAIEQGALRQLPARKGYTIGTVFDVSQTDCPPEKLPEVFPNRHVTGELKQEGAWMQGLHQLATDLGVTLDESSPYPFGAARGVFISSRHTIQLNPRNTPFENATVLTHELTHAALHGKGKDATALTPADKEFQAEMTAYVVHAHFGIETRNESLLYLAGWVKGKSLTDKKQMMGEVHETSLRFIQTLEKALEQQLGKTAVEVKEKGDSLPLHEEPHPETDKKEPSPAVYTLPVRSGPTPAAGKKQAQATQER